MFIVLCNELSFYINLWGYFWSFKKNIYRWIHCVKGYVQFKRFLYIVLNCPSDWADVNSHQQSMLFSWGKTFQLSKASWSTALWLLRIFKNQNKKWNEVFHNGVLHWIHPFPLCWLISSLHLPWVLRVYGGFSHVFLGLLFPLPCPSSINPSYPSRSSFDLKIFLRHINTGSPLLLNY